MPNLDLHTASAAPNPMAYTINADGTVTDQVTGLMWQRDVPVRITSGRRDRVLPDAAARRLRRLAPPDGDPARVADRRQHPQPDTRDQRHRVPGEPSDFFWSSTPLAGSPDVAWFVLFDRGTVSAFGTAGMMFYLRCVRS